MAGQLVSSHLVPAEAEALQCQPQITSVETSTLEQS